MWGVRTVGIEQPDISSQESKSAPVAGIERVCAEETLQAHSRLVSFL